MLKLLFPAAYADSVFDIDFDVLYKQGYRGIIFDVDNTLVHHGKDSNAQVNALFVRLHAIGFRTVVLSNNDSERIERFLKNIDAPYVCDADKPDTAGYQKALALLGVKRQEALCIGDQIFTDILGANRCGIDSILVHFIRSGAHERPGIRRRAEQVILALYRHSRRYQRLGNILKKEGTHHGT